MLQLIIAVIIIWLYVLFIMWFFRTAAPFFFQLGCIVMAITVIVDYVLAIAAMSDSKVNPPDTPVGKEPAYRQYFFRKAWIDYLTILGGSIGVDIMVGKWLLQGIRVLFVNPAFLLTWPLGVTLGMILGVGAIAAVLVKIALGVVHLAAVVLGCAVVLVTGAFFWTLESVFLLVSGIFVACPHAGCYRRIVLPAYMCPKCGALHRRLVPGRYGTFRRQCACGHKLATLYLFGRNRLPSYCPHSRCGKPLTAATGVTASLYFPIAGGPAAGKTSLLMACVSELQRLSTAGRLRLSFPDDAHKRLFEACRDAFARGVGVQKTGALAPDAFVVEMKHPLDGSRLVHAYDAAGELFQSSDSLHGHEYYSYINGIVFVIDPLSLDRLQSEIRYSPDPVAASSAPSAEAPQFVYDRMMQQLRNHMGTKGPIRRLPIAVVVTKSDAMGIGGRIDATTSTGAERGAHKASSGSVRAWLCANGEGNLVRSIENDFRHVRYFHCSALGRAPGADGSPFEPQGVLAPLGWLLGRSRFHGLPGSPPLPAHAQAGRVVRRLAPAAAAAAMVAAMLGSAYGLWTLAAANFGMLEVQGPPGSRLAVFDDRERPLLRTGGGLRLDLEQLWLTRPFAQFYRASLARGDANALMILRPGRYRVAVEESGSTTGMRIADVLPGRRNKVDATVPAGYGAWIVTSKPTARVFVDGHELGRTPIRVERIPAGRHQLVLRAERRAPVHEDFLVEVDESRRIDRRLARGTDASGDALVTYRPRAAGTLIPSSLQGFAIAAGTAASATSALAGVGASPPGQTVVLAQVSNVDDNAVLYINGQEAARSRWGQGPGGVPIGHRPGSTGWVDVTGLCRSGINSLRVVVLNSPGCCGASGTFMLRSVVGRDSSTLFYYPHSEQNSAAGVVLDRVFGVGISLPRTPAAIASAGGAPSSEGPSASRTGSAPVDDSQPDPSVESPQTSGQGPEDPAASSEEGESLIAEQATEAPTARPPITSPEFMWQSQEIFVEPKRRGVVTRPLAPGRDYALEASGTRDPRGALLVDGRTLNDLGAGSLVTTGNKSYRIKVRGDGKPLVMWLLESTDATATSMGAIYVKLTRLE